MTPLQSLQKRRMPVAPPQEVGQEAEEEEEEEAEEEEEEGRLVVSVGREGELRGSSGVF